MSRHTDRKTRFARTALAAAVATASVQASAATFEVTNTNATGAGSLNQAILDANESGAADEITFAISGTLPLNNQFLPSIIGTLDIIGPGSGALTIDAGNSPSESPLFRQNGGSGSISGLTVTGASYGVAQVIGEGTLNLDDINVSGQTFFTPAFIAGAASTTMIISNSQLRDNQLDSSSLISASSSANLAIDNSVITGNTSSVTPVLDLSGSTASIVDSTISNNTNTGATGAGALYGNTSSFDIEGSTFSGNSADFAVNAAGGGVLGSNNTATLSVSNSVFTGNSAGRGGVFNFMGGEGNSMTATVTGSSFTNNRAEGFSESSQGGVADLAADASLTIGGSVLSSNSADGSGGAIRGSGQSILSATNTVFSDNEALLSGGALSLKGETTLTRATITGNSAGTDGGGIRHTGSYAFSMTDSVVRANVSDGTGGGLQLNGADVDISNSLIADNTAVTSGGGITVLGQTSGNTGITASTVTGNMAPVGGGIDAQLYAGQTLALTESTISDNSGSAGSALELKTSASGGVFIHRSTISGNTGAGNSPAINASYNSYNNDSSYFVIDTSTLSGNSAANAGAAISISSIEDVQISHSTIVGNSANGTGSVQMHFGASYAYEGVSPVTAEAPLINISDSILSSNNVNEFFAGGDVFNSDGTSTVDGDSLEPTVSVVDSIVTQGYDSSVGAIVNPGAVQEVDAELEPLAANGGLTLTHMPIDATAPGVNTGEGGFNFGFDQRGAVALNTADIGSVEFTTNTAPYLDANLLAKLGGAPGKVVSSIVVADLFADDEGDTITTVSVSGLPDGLTYDGGLGTVSGTLAAAGEYFVTVTVTDDGTPALESTVQGSVVVKKKKAVVVSSSGGGGSLGAFALGLLAVLGLRRKGAAAKTQQR